MSIAALAPEQFVPRGPRSHWLLGLLPEMRRGRLQFFEHCAQAYGDFVLFELRRGRTGAIVNHPALVDDLLVAQASHFHKSKALNSNRRVFGNGLLVSEGDFWLRQRRLAQPAFHRQRINAYAETMARYGAEMVDGWQDGQTMDVQTAMLGVTLRIVGKTLFGADVAEEAPEVGQALRVLLETFLKRLERPFRIPDSWPTPENRRAEQVVQQLERIIYGFINDRRACGEDAGDLLSMLLAAQDEDGSQMTDRQLRDEVMTLFLAGHETTAVAMSWTLYLLANNPEADRRLASELRAVLDGRQPTLEDLPRLTYTSQAIAESMRLYPPAWIISREAMDDCTLGGQPVPKGAVIFASQWVIHHDERWFPAATEFRPERWTPEFQRQLPRFAYFPFGGGQRKCIGDTFATMEATLLLATIAQRFRLELAQSETPEPLPSITLRPRHGIRMTARAR